MKNLRQFAFGTLAVWLVASSAVMAFAAGDPPSRVARLKYISGEVSMQPGGVDDWAAATINRPMTTADRLWADKDSRAELHLGSAAIRIDSETSLTLSNLSDNTVQLELDEGTLNLEVARMFNGEIYEVDTPNAAFTIIKPGNYRFDVDSNDDNSLVTVWKGKVVATGSGQAVRVDSNRQARFMGGMSLTHAMYHAPRVDGFDQWCQLRAEREARVISARYVSSDVIGYEDLDEYGAWRMVPSYGAVWFPTRVVAGWAPYRYGHWVWIEPWGWTWVDDAAWGFAPFHYGRWVFVTGSWAWVPGPANVRPCYAPALVAWVGSSGAGIGWFPLGYGEPYIPYYHVSRSYFETVNVSNTRITNITYVTNNYYNVTNVRITNIHYVHQTSGITIVNNDVLVNSRRVDHDVFIDRDHDRDWRDHHDGWVTAGPPVAPSHRAVVGVVDYHRTQQPPDRILNRRVVENITPPQRPVRFDDKRDELEAHHGRPLDRDEEDRLRRTIPDQRRPNQPGDRDTQAANDRGRGPQRDDDHRSDDRDRHDSASDDRRNPSWNEHGSYRGDNDQQNARGNNPDWRRGNQNGNGNDDKDQHGNSADTWRNNNANSGGERSDDSYSRRQFPRPPRHGNDDQGQPSAGGMNNSDQHPQNQNQNGNSDRGQRADSGDNSRGYDSNANSQRSDDWSGRQFPHPPRRGNYDPGQPSAGGMNSSDQHQNQNPNGNNDNGQRADSGDHSRGNNSNANSQRSDDSSGRQFPHPPRRGNDDPGQASAGGMNNSDQHQQNQNQNGNGDRSQRADSRDNSQNNNANPGSQRSDDSNGRQFPRPSRRGNEDQGQQGSQQGGSLNPSAGRNVSVPDEQVGSGIRGRGPDRAERPMPPTYGGNGTGSNPSQPAVHEVISQPSGGSSVPRPPATPAQPSNPRGDSPGSDRQVNRPASSGSFTAPPQQADRSQPRPQTESRPAAPPQRAAAPERSQPAQPHGSSNKDASSKASGFQDRDHGKVQDR